MTLANIKNNPIVPVVGARDSDATIITSEQTTEALVLYQVENINTGNVITIDSSMNGKAGGNIVSVDRTTLKIILESRTRYRVRTKSQFGPWSTWVIFKTRDKRYQSPELVTQLTDDTDSSSQTQGRKTFKSGASIPQGGSRTIVVTNNAKSTEVENSPSAYNTARIWGTVTVVNTDTVFNDGQLQDNPGQSFGNPEVPVLNTNRGATVINVPSGANNRITYTNRGATIDTRG